MAPAQNAAASVREEFWLFGHKKHDFYAAAH